MADDTPADSAKRHRPKSTTVFVAAFVAGAVAAVVVNRALDLHLAQSKPQVESEPIFVALRALPQGSPVTVWDVALRDWPCAMLPSSALRAKDSFEGSVLKYPLREGQPLLSVQLMPASQPTVTPVAPTASTATLDETFVMPAPAPAPTSVTQAPKDDRPTASDTAADPRTEQKVTDSVATAPSIIAPRPSPAVASEPAVVSTVPLVADTAAPRDATTPLPVPERKRFELEPIATTQTPSSSAQEPSAATDIPEDQPTRVASDVEPLLDMPSRPAVDLEKIPSVMARSEKPAEPADTTTASGAVRYLVVPERIARQADTSFVSPPAVEPASEPSPVPPVAAASPTPAAAAQQAKALPPQQPKTRKPQQAAGKPAPQQRAPRSANGDARPMPQQRTDKPQPQAQQRPATTNKQQRPAPAPSQPQRQAKQQPPNKPSDRSPAETAEPKPRGPMFPNITAGLEAMGNRWRGEGDEAVATDIPSDQRRK